jgi:hypothetical protein
LYKSVLIRIHPHYSSQYRFSKGQFATEEICWKHPLQHPKTQSSLPPLQYHSFSSLVGPYSPSRHQPYINFTHTAAETCTLLCDKDIFLHNTYFTRIYSIAGSRKSRLTAVGIRCYHHGTPSIRKSWH